MSRKTRKFTEDDLAVWRRVKSTIAPLPASQTRKTRTTLNVETDEPDHKPIRLGAPAPLKPTQSSLSIDLKSQIPTQHIDGLHRSQRRAIKKGQIEADAFIDLHGMRLEQAHARFRQFITQASQNGARVVLVVTGKGGHARLSDFGVEISGVIKRAFPEWMVEPSLAPLVHHYAPAHIKHGGDGAWYVFLRNPKKAQNLKQKHGR